MEELNRIKELIEQYDSIVIYRHIHPDFDAYGSQLGLKYLIKENYPEKKVYTGGFDRIEDNEFVEEMDNPDLETIRNSLVIVADTSTSNRIDGQNVFEGQKMIKFDHHRASEPYADINYVEEDACSCTSIIASVFRELGFRFSNKSASYLVAGIYTDTCSLAVDSVSSKTFEILSFLMNYDVDLVRVNQYCYADSIEVYKANNYIRNKVVFEKDSAYVIVKREDIEKFSIPASEYNNMVDVMANIKGVNRYSLFTEMQPDQYRCSLRSHKQPIREIAMEYGGGGHNMAAGVNPLTLKQVMEVIEKMRDLQ